MQPKLDPSLSLPSETDSASAGALNRREFFTTVGKTLGGVALAGAAAQGGLVLAQQTA